MARPRLRRPTVGQLAAEARRVDETRAKAVRGPLEGVGLSGAALEVAVLLATAYPAEGPGLLANPDLPASLVGADLAEPKRSSGYLAELEARVGDLSDAPGVLAALRRFARRERLRIALRELLPESQGGADVDVTSAELAALADATIEIAYREAHRHQVSRLRGAAAREAFARSGFVVLGMGKLGGQELNPGSDVDLIYLYDDLASDDPDLDAFLFEQWTKVAKRLTQTLESITSDGFVWRVDLRLRPEGSTGPIVSSLSSIERYYESFGRLWERAALLRARPVAGDLAFGQRALSMLSPFVWTKRIDPGIALEMIRLARRARVELAEHAERDLKLGPGGIREAEFFVQSLALIWGGREPSIRQKGTLPALAALGARGLVTDREGVDIFNAYLALRRAEHAVQVQTGRQTHELPDEPEELERLARVLGFADRKLFLSTLSRQRAMVSRRFNSLAPDGAPPVYRWTEALAALDNEDETLFVEAFVKIAGFADARASERDREAPVRERARGTEAAHSLFALARHPDGLLGGRTRDKFRTLADALLDAVADAADPEQAARYLRFFSERVRRPAVYVQLLADDPAALRRLVAVLGASAFVGDALVQNPELGDMILFDRETVEPEQIERDLLAATGAASAEGAFGPMSARPGEEDPDEVLVGVLRRAKARWTLLIALADLADQIEIRRAMLALSALADASLEAATRRALGTPAGVPPRGLAIIAMGKLGGREIGYGSDLDVIFVFEPTLAPRGADPTTYFTRCARRIISYVSMSHAAGAGYELDTRLRPSGNQGMLVTSIEAFARYHDFGSMPGEGGASRKAATWERLALLRSRVCAGDPELGARVIEIAAATAYGGREDPGVVASEIHRIRSRVAEEASLERPGRHDLKLGYGGLMEAEFAVQMLQMTHPTVAGVRTSETLGALEALGQAAVLDAELSDALQGGYAFLRRLEQRIRIVHADASHLLDEHDPGLVPLARRMGFRELPDREDVAEQLLARYREVTARVRGAYEAIVVAAMGP